MMSLKRLTLAEMIQNIFNVRGTEKLTPAVTDTGNNTEV